jgi:hypothetical protein
MWRCVDIVSTDVSKERTVPIFRIEKSAEFSTLRIQLLTPAMLYYGSVQNFQQ